MSELNRTIKFRVNLGRAIITETKSVNGKQPDNEGDIALYAGDIPLTQEQGSQSVATAIENALNKDASGIMYDAENLITVKQAIDGIQEETEEDFTETEVAEILDEVFGGDE